jgi:hypothetical protein
VVVLVEAMTAVPVPDMLSAALDAYDAGLCVVRAHADGSKRPFGTWREYQAERPSRATVATWFADGHPAMGAICGAVSGELELFELEGRFVEMHGTKDFLKRCKERGLELLMKRLVNGMLTISPSDGRHFLWRVDGGPVDGNTKLASTSDSLTLIETRGEGGFVMLAPSHGTTHPSGKPWTLKHGSYATIPTITLAEREALFEVARSYDEAKASTPLAPVAPTARVAQRLHAGEVGGSWMDAVVEHLADSWPMQELLEQYGWTYCYTDRHGRHLMHRPGKDGDGVGGSINLSDRFHPFSSSTPFPNASADRMSPTYDRLDVIATYEYGGDRAAAAREIAERTGIMDAWKRAKDAPYREVAGVVERQPPAGIDPVTGELEAATSTVWDERPVLAHIRDAAHARMVAPYAVFGCVAARVAAFAPPSSCIPPIVGGRAPLSLYIALHGASGAGKSSPVACAADLIPNTPPGVVGPLGLGSGEGLVEAFMDLVEEDDGNGKKRKVKRQKHRGALFTLDEGQMLAEIGARKGSTILPVLRTAWSGDDPGQANASIETRRSLRKGSYHVGLISLWQDKAGAALIEDVDGGTPQRFVWLPTTDPTFPDEVPPWPGPLDVELPASIASGGIAGYHPVGIAQEIHDEIREKRIQVIRGHLKEPPLDSHRRLNKLKLAAVLAILDGRHDVTVDDWRIAEHFMCISDAVRDTVLDRSRERLAEQLRNEANRYALRESVVQDAATAKALGRAARAAWKAASKSDSAVSRRDITHSIASRDRALVTADEAIEEALRLSWLTPAGPTAEHGWTTGKARPA